MFGYVFYGDGGCRPQYGYGGAGIHGYRWNLDLTAKGIGHSSFSASFKGYASKGETFDFVNKEDKASINTMTRDEFQHWLTQDSPNTITIPADAKAADGPKEKIGQNLSYRVPVERYYDSFIPLAFGGTNNTAEVWAAIHSLERVEQEPDFGNAALVVIRSDSKYTVDGHNIYLPNWIARDFIRKDGTVVTNKDLWMRVHAASQSIQSKGVKVIFEWVRGHNGDLGNESADDLATAAVFASKNPKTVAELNTDYRISEANDYWGTRSDQRHPMMCFRYGYLSVTELGADRKEYYLSTQGKAEELSGKRSSDDGFAVIRCAPQKIIEELVVKQASLPREIDYKFMIDFDNLYGSDSRYLNLYGTDFLHRAVDHKRHLQTYGELLVTKELHPPYLSERVFDNMDILGDFLDNYQKTDQPTLLTTDITDYFCPRDRKSVV